MTSIVFSSSCPAQLFRLVQSLTSLPLGNQKDKESAIRHEVFMSYFVCKISLLHQDLPATVDIIHEMEASWLSLDPVLDSFNQLSQK